MRGSAWGGAVIAVAIGAGCEVNPLFDPNIAAGGGSDPDALIEVANLRAAWETPNQIRWEWDPQGDADDLAAYELVVGPSEQAVLGRGPGTTVWTAAQNPELGVYLLQRTGSPDVVRFTVTDGHDPNTTYYAQLTATDKPGQQSVSAVVPGTTKEQFVDEIVIFADEDTPGLSIPDTFQLSTARPYAGSTSYRYQSACADGSQCWENLRRQEMSIDVSAISEGSFQTTAYYEVAVAVENASTSWWSSMWIWFDGSDNSRLANYGGFTLRTDDEYRVLQVPLREFLLENDGGPVPYEELALGLFGVNLGGAWTDGAVVYIDEIRIRW